MARASSTRQISLALVAVCALGTTVGGWLVEAQTSAPAAEIIESIQDAGTVARGTKIERTFRIKNSGEHPLEIVDVKPNCGCTVTEYDRTIAPGETGKVVATVDTKNFDGPIAKSVRVFTNDAENPELHLVVKANVRTFVGVSPGYAHFLTVRGEPIEPSQQVIWSETVGDLEILGAESPFPYLAVEVRPATPAEAKPGRPAKQWLVTMTLDPTAPTGSLADFVVLKTNHPRQRELKIPISGFVRPVVTALPRVADFGRKELRRAYTATIEVKNLGSGEISLGPVATNLSGVETRLETIEAGKRYKVRVTLTPEMPKGAFDGKLTIETTSTLEPLVEVGLRGTVL